MIQKSDIDFGKTSKDYAKHRAGFPRSFFESLQSKNFLTKKSKILDVGTGTGTIARGLAEMGHETFGLDPSPHLLDEARELDRHAHVTVDYSIGTSEATGFNTATFDIVTAGQCWHWFDPVKALKEIHRILKPNGTLIVAYFDWVSAPNNPVDVMTRVRKKYNPNWKSSWPLGFYPQAPGDLKFEGFQSIDSFQYEEDISYTHEGWRGRMRAYAGVGGSLKPDIIEAFDKEFAIELKKHFPEEPMLIPHKVWAEMWKRN